MPRRVLSVLLALFVAGCTTCEIASLPPAPPSPPEPEAPPPVIKKARPKGAFRVGQPYRINGVLYRPALDWDYDETGKASWYGAAFHGRLTANGELYDQNELTAAHQTLPLPSMVRVTNLENGRSLVVRVNDRGPFIKGRILDVSRKAAKLLKFQKSGVTTVRVEILEKESRQAAAEMGWEG